MTDPTKLATATAPKIKYPRASQSLFKKADANNNKAKAKVIPGISNKSNFFFFAKRLLIK
jgi:hypothetical protein